MKQEFTIISFFIFFHFFNFCYSGHIYSQTSEIIPQNAKYAKNFHLYFMLETSLIMNDCLYVVFPMNMGSSTATISQSFDPTIAGTMATISQKLDGDPTKDTTFYQLTTPLDANIWYRIQITLGDLSQQIAGVQGCIWFASTSDYHSNYITYDENRCFDLISFAPEVDTVSLQVNGYYAYADSNKINSFGQSYGVYFDVIPNQIVYFPGARIRLVINPGTGSLDSFTFGNTCSNIQCSGNSGTSGDYCPANGINAIPNNAYNCSVSNNILNFYINQMVSKQIFRISASIINPLALVSTTITAYYLSQKTEIYFSLLNSIAAGSVNPLSLMTNYPTLIMNADSVLLFWGVAYQDLSVKNGYVGCPIYLYTSNSNNYIVFNSMKTSFTLVSTIPSLSFHSNLQAVWTVINVIDAVEMFLMNSINSNFPGEISCINSIVSGSIATIICQGITDLSAAFTYYISGKFALTRGSTFLSTFSPPPNPAPIGGGIVVKTGDSMSNVLQVNGISIGVKRNIEYYDSGIANTGDGSSKYYNQLFSYWSSDTVEYNMVDSAGSVTNTLNTFKTKFLGLTSGKAATAAVWTKGTSTKTQALMLQFTATPTLMCTSTAHYVGTVTSPCDGTGGASANYVVLLKIIFNNNVLGIPKTNFIKGVKIIGTLFQVYSSSVLLYGTTYNSQNYNWYPQQTGINADPLVNYIDKKGGGIIPSFWHVSVLCYAQTIDASCYNILPYSGTINPSVSGISFIDTNINTYPTMYSDIEVLDFIICFKLLPYSSYTVSSSNLEISGWKLLEEGTTVSSTYNAISGPGIINGYVITSAVNTPKISTVNTYIKTSASVATDYGYSNNYIQNGIPSYLRIGLTVTSLTVAGTYIGVFINGEIGVTGLYTGLAVYSDTNGNVTILDTIAESQVVGTLFQGSTEYYANTNDIWWAHSGFLIPAKTIISSTNTFNFYIPIQTTFKNILSMNIAIIDRINQGKMTILAVYRVYGSIFNSAILTGTYSNIGLPIKTFHSVSTMTTTSFPTNYQTPWDQGSNGCQSGSTTSIATPVLGTNSETILPGKTLSTLYFKSDVINSGGSDCNINSGNSGNYWGSAFIVFGRENINIFDSSTILKWDLAGTAPITNKCLFHNIFSGTGFLYTILCTVDAGNGVATNIGSSSSLLTFSKFIVPFFWGESVDLTQRVTYSWSDIYGRAVMHNPDTTVTSNWFYSTCLTSGITNLPQNTYDAAITISLSSTSVTYNLQQSDSLYVVIQTTQTAVTFVSECNVINYSCATAGGLAPTYILTVSNQKTLLAGSSISINSWVDTNGVTNNPQPTYTVLLKYYNAATLTLYPASEQCSVSSGGAIISVTSTQLSNQVLISSLNYVNMQTARGSFSLIFKYLRPIRTSYYISINIGVFGSPTKINNNYRCLIYDANGGLVDNRFSLLSPLDTNFQMILSLKNIIKNNTGFLLQCLGGNSPDGNLDPQFNPIWVSVYRSGGTLITVNSPSNQVFLTTTIPFSIILNSITMTKVFQSKGMGSDYIFKFKPMANNITIDGRVYIEFSQSIPPKLNKNGYLECYFNEISCFCEFIDERRISIYILSSLLTTSPIFYTIRIAGVTQPYLADLDNNKKVYFALDMDNNPYNGISEHKFLPDTFDTTFDSISSIFIHDITYINQKIRSSMNISMIIYLPGNSIINDGCGLWIQMPASLGPGLYYGGNSITITLQRVYNTTYKNLVKGISIEKGRRIYVSLIADYSNTFGLNYTLNISNLITPLETSNYIRDSVIIFISANNLTITSISASGARNTTNYLQFQEDSSVILLNWLNSNSEIVTDQNPLLVLVGYYHTTVNLTAGGNYENSWYFSFNGGNVSSFSVQPPTPLIPLRVVNGLGDAIFYIAAKPEVYLGGKYFMSGIKTTDVLQLYSLLPFLNIKPIQINCTPILSATTFDVPYSGGTSDPIIIDITHCPPIDDITVTANISYGFNLTYNNGISFSGAQNQNITLTFTDMSSLYKVAFYATSNDDSIGTNANNVATIDFQIIGTDGIYYNTPSSVSINLVSSSKEIPIPMSPLVVNSMLSVGCDQKGTNFFALGLRTSASSISLKTISSKTLSGNIVHTTPDIKNDPYYKVYGCVSGLTPSAYTQISLKGFLKAGDNYTVYSYCMSNSLISNTVPKNYSWAQPDNGGKTVVLRIRFAQKLTTMLKLDFACALSKVLMVLPSRVYTDEGSFCPLLRRRFLQTIGGNNFSVFIANNTDDSYTAVFVILKDYLSDNDDVYQTVIDNAEQEGFISNVITQTTSGAANFPQPLDAIPVLTILDAFSYIYPVVLYQSLLIDSDSFNITLNLTNISGFLFAAIAYVNASTPNITQLRNGIDGFGVALIFRFYETVNAGGSVNFSFTPLISMTNYVLFYAGTNLDTSINSLTSNVSRINVTTTQGSNFFTSWEEMLRAKLGILIGLMILLMNI